MYPSAREIRRHPNDAGWEAQLAKLEGYKRRHGDCNVPRGWTEDPSIGAWVKHQRAYKRRLDRGEPSEGMTADSAGVAADGARPRLGGWSRGWRPVGGAARAAGGLQGAAQRLQRTWVAHQRKRKKALDRGEPSSGMTVARVAKLEALGFAWTLWAAALSKAKRNDAGWERGRRS